MSYGDDITAPDSYEPGEDGELESADYDEETDTDPEWEDTEELAGP